MRKARISAARVFGAALAALLLVCGLLFVTGSKPPLPLPRQRWTPAPMPMPSSLA